MNRRLELKACVLNESPLRVVRTTAVDVPAESLGAQAWLGRGVSRGVEAQRQVQPNVYGLRQQRHGEVGERAFSAVGRVHHDPLHVKHVVVVTGRRQVEDDSAQRQAMDVRRRLEGSADLDAGSDMGPRTYQPRLWQRAAVSTARGETRAPAQPCWTLYGEDPYRSVT